MSTPTSPDPTHLFATLERSEAGLSLDHKDLCVLVALSVHIEGQGLASVSEDALRDVFERTWQHVEPAALNVRKAATERIEKLRNQRLLNRLAASRYAAESDYALSTLAMAIVRFFHEDERLTRESLDVLTRTLEAELVQALQALREVSADEVDARVLQPMRVSVSTLLGGIANRQQGLDRQQEELRDEVTERLGGTNEAAMEAATALLEGMTNTLAELTQVLMRDCARLQEVVDQIAQTASALDREDVGAAAADVGDKLHRVEGWGQSRLDTWTEYHEHVHRHIRMVVSLDPNRALSHGLRELMRHGPRWSLAACKPERWRGLREVVHRRPPVRVRRELRQREELPEEEAAPVEGRVEQAVRTALAQGPTTYLALARDLLPDTPPSARHRMLGELARQLSLQGIVEHPRDRSWHPLDAVEVHDWRVAPGGEDA